MSKFLDNLKKEMDSLGIDHEAAEPPRYWFSSGNYVLNKILSGSFLKAIPQGRITCFAGASGTGKSFLVCNALREAQKENAQLVVIDSENALDNDFVQKIGVNTDKDYAYIPVSTVPEVQNVVSKIIKGYKEDCGVEKDAPPLVIAIDSLDMLMTETEEENFNKGITKGDQGQRNKQLKAMLRQFVQAIKFLNISIIVTAQVYKNQDLLNGEGVWIVSDAIRFSLSHIALLTKLKLRNVIEKSIVDGIKLKAEGMKTRFTQPFQTVTLEVPYHTGMDPFNGLLDAAVELNVITKGGSWYYIPENDIKFQKSDFGLYKTETLIKCEAKREKFLEALIEEDLEEDNSNPEISVKEKRQRKASSKKESLIT